MKRIIIEVDDGIGVDDALETLKEVELAEEFILSLKVELVKEE